MQVYICQKSKGDTAMTAFFMTLCQYMLYQSLKGYYLYIIFVWHCEYEGMQVYLCQKSKGDTAMSAFLWHCANMYIYII